MKLDSAYQFASVLLIFFRRKRLIESIHFVERFSNKNGNGVTVGKLAVITLHCGVQTVELSGGL